MSAPLFQQLQPAVDAPLSVWLDYYLAMHSLEIDMGLTRIRQVAQQMNLLTLPNMKVITVGGTNGKGTTCAMLESILRVQGLRVGVYSSPHIIHYNERIRIDGIDASDTQIIEAFQAIELARGEISLTFFEVATLAGLWLFQQQAVEVAILEVGLGGRLDATNIIDADLAMITSIDLDHQEFLGETREAVGFEKAGIYKAGKYAVTGEPNLPATVLEVTTALGVELQRVGQEFRYQRHAQSFSFQGRHWNFSELPLPKLPLPNAATCLAGLELLYPALELAVIEQGLAAANLSGRFETISQQPRVILDVAHNPHAAKYLLSQLQLLQAQGQFKRLIALCGMLKDKDYAAVLSILTPHVDAWYFATLKTERTAQAEDLLNALQKQQIKAQSVQAFDDLCLAWNSLQTELKEDDLVIVFGSFYTVSGLKAVLNLG